ncbi:MAG TPA: AraC family transcriptional regulator ligand-binding domain-containing protein [Sphingomonadaceae bacterium]
MGASVSSAALMPWRKQAQRLRVDSCEEGCASGSATVPLNVFVGWTEGIATRCGYRSLGWLLGSEHDLRLLYDVGQVVLTCSTLGAALRRFADYFPLIQDATELSICEEGRHCTVTYRILDPEIWPRHQDAIFTLAVVAQLIRKAAPKDWKEVEAFVEDPDPAAAHELARLIGITCCSGADGNSLRFPHHFLDMPLPPEPGLVPPDLRQLASLVAQKRRQTGIVELVRAQIYQRLGSAQIGQPEIARALGMSSRTLRRRMAQEGVSFQRIFDDCRMRQALHEFQARSPISVAQTALRLGYSEHSTFTRAFRRWSGQPPQAFIARR